MGYDGAGNYTRTRNFSADASAGIKILASAVDEELNDFASAMTLPLLRGGQNSPTADIPMGGYKLTNVGAPASASNYIRASDVIQNIPIYMEDATTSTDNISVSAQYFTTASAGAAPAGGTRILIKMGSDKGSAPALHLNAGDGNPYSANVVLQNGSVLWSGALYSGGIYDFVFASAASLWQLMNPSQNTSNTDRPGIIEIATTAEADAGTDTTRAMTPDLVRRLTSTETLAATTASAGVIEIATTAEVLSASADNLAVTPTTLNAVVGNLSASIEALNSAAPYLGYIAISSGSSPSFLSKNSKASAWTVANAGGSFRVTHNIGLASAGELIVQLQKVQTSAAISATNIALNIASAGNSSFRYFLASGNAVTTLSVNIMMTAHKVS